MKASINSGRPAPISGRTRGSVLITALVFAALFAVALASYLSLSSTSLKLAHRTFLADSAVNLAETGLEEAVWSFNKMGNSSDPTVIADAWSAWTRNNTIADAYMSNMGSGYTSAPTVTITGGGGSGATGTATITTSYIEGSTVPITRVTSVTITSPGSGYTSVPTITLSGGGGTGAAAIARFAATRTLTFNDLDANATATVKVWAAGYNGTAVVPIVIAKATITPSRGQPVEKYVKVILSKNGILPKGLVAFDGINWNGHPLADSYLSSASPGVPPFTPYDEATARANTTVASLAGVIDLSQGTVAGNVMTGAGVTVTGHGDISGETIGNFTFPFTMPDPPATDINLGASVPAVLPRAGDSVGRDGKYWYSVNNVVIGDLTVTEGKEIVIVGSHTSMVSGLKLRVVGTAVAKATIYMDGPITLAGNDQINATAATDYNWAGSLDIYTTTTDSCTFSGNAKFYGCLTAPNSALVGNGSGSDQVDLCGSFVVGSVTSNGHMNFHYDEGLRNLTPARAWGLALWKELQTADERALYSSKLNF